MTILPKSIVKYIKYTLTRYTICAVTKMEDPGKSLVLVGRIAIRPTVHAMKSKELNNREPSYLRFFSSVVPFYELLV